MQNFENFTFDHLNNLQIGRIGEYWAKIWLTLGGFETYTVDVDDRGIDFVMKNQQNDFYKIQVKSIKRPTSSIFITKKGEWETDKLNKNLFLCVVIFENYKSPEIFLIPSTVWLNQNNIFKDRKYENGQSSKPEWGINISKKNMIELKEYELKLFIENQLKRPNS